MFFSNTRADVINRANVQTNNTYSAVLHQTRAVYVDKEQFRIKLTPLEDISNPTKKKQRGFDQLKTAVLSLRNTYQVADIMRLVRQEVSIYVDFAAQDSTK